MGILALDGFKRLKWLTVRTVNKRFYCFNLRRFLVGPEVVYKNLRGSVDRAHYAHLIRPARLSGCGMINIVALQSAQDAARPVNNTMNLLARIEIE